MMDNFEGRNPEVSESADNAAEQKAINAQEIHDFKETLISSVSSGVLDSVVGRPDEFESQLRRTLDELIMTYFRNHVNTAEISDEKIQTLSADLQKIMTDFVKSVQGGVGMALDASDVRDVYDIDSQLDQSKLQFAKTIFTCFVMSIGSLMFSSDTENIIIVPITKMVGIIKQLADDPL